MNSESSNLRVFLCHANQDKPLVRDLNERLKAAGVQTWLDEANLLPGQDWECEIMNAVEQSHIILICLSRSSVTKTGYVQKELRRALDLGELRPEGSIFLIPVRLNTCVVPKRLRQLQWVDLYQPDGFEKLLTTLRLQSEKVGISLFVHEDILSSIRTAIEKGEFEEIVSLCANIDVNTLTDSQVDELFWALVSAKVKLDQTSQQYRTCLRQLMVCFGRLRILRPNNLVTRWGELTNRIEYATLLSNSEEFAEAAHQLEPILAVESIERVNADWRKSLANAHVLYCNALEHQQRFDALIQFVNRSLEKWETQAGSAVVCSILSAVKASSLAKMGNTDASLSVVYQIIQQTQLRDQQNATEALDRAIGYLYKLQSYATAIPLLRAALNLTSDSNSTESRERVANLYYILAECQRKDDDCKEAVKTGLEMLARFPEADTASIEGSTAWCMTELQRSLRALERFDEAITISEQCFERFKDSANDSTRSAVAWAYAEMGESSSGAKLYEQALEQFANFFTHFDRTAETTETSTDFEWQISYALGEKARCLGLLKRFEEAVATCDEAIERYASTTNADVLYEVAWCTVEKAFNLRRAGRLTEAHSTYTEALQKFSGNTRDDFRKEVRAARDGVGFCVLLNGKLKLRQGEIELGNSMIDEAENTLIQANNEAVRAEALYGLAQIALTRKEPARAQFYLREAYKLGDEEWRMKMLDEATNLMPEDGEWIDLLKSLEQ